MKKAERERLKRVVAEVVRPDVRGCCGSESGSRIVATTDPNREGAVVFLGVPAWQCTACEAISRDLELACELEKLAKNLPPGRYMLVDLVGPIEGLPPGDGEFRPERLFRKSDVEVVLSRTSQVSD